MRLLDEFAGFNILDFDNDYDFDYDRENDTPRRFSERQRRGPISPRNPASAPSRYPRWPNIA